MPIALHKLNLLFLLNIINSNKSRRMYELHFHALILLTLHTFANCTLSHVSGANWDGSSEAPVSLYPRDISLRSVIHLDRLLKLPEIRMCSPVFNYICHSQKKIVSHRCLGIYFHRKTNMNRALIALRFTGLFGLDLLCYRYRRPTMRGFSVARTTPRMGTYK